MAEQFDCLFILDAFRDRLEAECACQADNRFDDVQVGGVSDQVADELDIDFQVGDGQLLEVGEAAEAGAEVVEGQPAAEFGQPAGEGFAGGRCRA